MLITQEEYNAMTDQEQAEYDDYLWDLAYDQYMEAKAEYEAENPTN